MIPRFEKKRILIADDDEDLVVVLATLLEGSGFEVIAAHEGVKVIELCLSHNPHLVIMDLNMPMGTGQTMLQLLKTNPQTKDIPVIVLTGMDDKHVKEKVIALGAEAYIRKPFDSDNIVKCILEILKME